MCCKTNIYGIPALLMHARVSGFFLCPNTEAYGDTLHDKHSGASDTCDSGKKNKKKTAVPGHYTVLMEKQCFGNKGLTVFDSNQLK